VYIQGGSGQSAFAETTVRSVPPEIAFLARHGVAAETLAEAARLAEAAGVPADEALIRHGLASEETFYRALAVEAHLTFEAGPLAIHPMARFPESVLAGLVPLATSEAPVPRFAYAPRGREVAELLANRHHLAPGFCIATPTCIRDSLLVSRGPFVAALAADGLASRRPDLSYRGGASGLQLTFTYVLGVASGVSCVAAPDESWAVLSILLGLAFLGSTALRLAAVLEHVPVAPPRLPPRMPDCDLPTYTILIALYREARIVPRLLRAIAAIDYPASKLDVKFIIEAMTEKRRRRSPQQICPDSSR
jgi:hypothetical protein